MVFGYFLKSNHFSANPVHKSELNVTLEKTITHEFLTFAYFYLPFILMDYGGKLEHNQIHNNRGQ